MVEEGEGREEVGTWGPLAQAAALARLDGLLARGATREESPRPRRAAEKC